MISWNNDYTQLTSNKGLPGLRPNFTMSFTLQETTLILVRAVSGQPRKAPLPMVVSAVGKVSSVREVPG